MFDYWNSHWKLKTMASPLRCPSPAEAPVWSWFPRHFQDSRHVAGWARGGGGRAFWTRLRQPRGASSRESRARVRHAVAPLSKHLPGAGVGEERDKRHRGAAGSPKGPQREIPDSRPRDRIYLSAQPLHGGQRAEESGRRAEAAHQTGTTAREESGWLMGWCGCRIKPEMAVPDLWVDSQISASPQGWQALLPSAGQPGDGFALPANPPHSPEVSHAVPWCRMLSPLFVSQIEWTFISPYLQFFTSHIFSELDGLFMDGFKIKASIFWLFFGLDVCLKTIKSYYTYISLFKGKDALTCNMQGKQSIRQTICQHSKVGKKVRNNQIKNESRSKSCQQTFKKGRFYSTQKYYGV